LNAFQNFRLGGLLVQRLVDVGHVERLNRRREPLQLAECRFERVGQRKLELVQERERRLAHYDHELRLDDVQLAGEPRPRLLRVAPGELEGVCPVDRHRIDVQPLQGLQHRLARTAVEGDSLLHLRRLRLVLEQEHVCERMAGPQHRHTALAGGASDLVPEIVDLGDRFLQVLLEDFVGHGWHQGLDPVLA